MAEKYYTVKEIAERFRKDIRTVYRWIREGSLEADRAGGGHIISETKLQEFLSNSKQKSLNKNV